MDGQFAFSEDVNQRIAWCGPSWYCQISFVWGAPKCTLLYNGGVDFLRSFIKRVWSVDEIIGGCWLKVIDVFGGIRIVDCGVVSIEIVEDVVDTRDEVVVRWLG